MSRHHYTINAEFRMFEKMIIKVGIYKIKDLATIKEDNIVFAIDL